MPFIDTEFMLKTKTARKLYHEYAEGLPIIDYHCHLPPAMIAENYRFRDASELFLGGDHYGDHYKWRLMRANGVDERLITGDADGYDKWLAFAKTLPLAIGNPVYHWTHLELKRYFGVDETLSPANAKAVWDHVNACLKRDEFTAQGLILRSNVELICTTDAPGDTLEYHRRLKDFPVRILPAFRPDLRTAGPDIVGDIDFFHENGCRLSDHAVETFDPETVDALIFLGREYARRGWTMQLHIGALRNNNARAFAEMGADTGYDSAGDANFAEGLAGLLDALEREDALPKTVLYYLNPKDEMAVSTLAGCFQKPPAGKLQVGCSWWFNDQRDGMERELRLIANVGLLARFIGMTTDSRSFVSYPRHEYFRRIVCDLLGRWVEDGEYPADWETLGAIVRGICHDNAKTYFAF